MPLCCAQADMPVFLMQFHQHPVRNFVKVFAILFEVYNFWQLLIIKSITTGSLIPLSS